MAQKKHPVIIVGGGPAGAVTAMYLLRRGIRPVIVERDIFPRYHVGETMTGATAVALRELGLGGAMDAQPYPVKHGATFYGTDGKNAFWVPIKRRNAEGVQVPNQTWSVLRSTFDQILFNAALERGAEWIGATAVAPLKKDDRVTGLSVRTPSGTTENLFSEVLIDASGSATFLANRRVTGPKLRGNYDKQIALFTQFSGTIRDSGSEAHEQPGNVLLFYEKKNHWAWFIPVSDELTSVGVVFPSEYFKQAGLSKEEMLLRECRTMNAALSARLPDLTFREQVYAAANFSYRVMNYTGKGFLCVGDAHRFIDPIFAYGIFFAVREAEFAAETIAHLLSEGTRTNGNPFAEYEALCDQGNDITQDFVDCLWEYPLAFQRMVVHKYREAIIDIFAGRIYGEIGASNPAAIAMHKLLAPKGEVN
jgi:1H-pyrrole-2-carbonyl-[peptidyl-carrier protein] brominase